MYFKQPLSPYLSGVLMAIIFGHTFLFIKIAMEYMQPLVLLTYRFGSATFGMLLLWRLGIIRLQFGGASIKPLLRLAIFYPIIGFLFEMIGVQYTSASQAGILISLNPLFVMWLAAWLLKEWPNRMQRIFLLSSVCGVLVTVVYSSFGGDSGNAFGTLLLLVSMLGGAIQNVLARKHSDAFGSAEISFVMVALGAVCFGLLALLQGLWQGTLWQDFTTPLQHPQALWSVIYLGVIASIFGFLTLNYTLANLSAVRAAMFVNGASIIATFAGVIWAHETLHLHQIIGGIFILIGVWGTNFYAKEPSQERTEVHTTH